MAEAQPKRVLILTGGGDCPGLNAVIRAVVKTAVLKYGWEAWGSEDSFAGLLGFRQLLPLTPKLVQGILPRGGTILGTSNKADPFAYPRRDEGSGAVEAEDLSQRAISRFREKGFDALIAVGGDGTLSIALKFLQLGLPVIGVPKTIDNDLMCTEQSFGFDTALRTATEAIDKIHTTAESHDRVMVVEVMGRNSGWIALHAGVAGGADIVLIPEIPFRIESVCRKIRQRAAAGRRFSIVVVAEGASPDGGQQVFRSGLRDDPFTRLGGISFSVADAVSSRLGLETRVVVLGHLQRGGSPSPFDRLLATRFGHAAVELVSQERFGQMVSLRCGRIDSVPLQQAVVRQRQVETDHDLLQAARATGISLGD